MEGREDSKADSSSDPVSEEANQNELEAPLIIRKDLAGTIVVSGPLAREALGLIRDVRKTLKPWTALYGPRGTEIKRTVDG